MKRIKKGIQQSIPEAKVKGIAASGVDVARLMVRRDGATVKIEPNFILRGTVFSPIEMELCQTAQREFELFTTALVVSHADLYGGKLCAALDRQHPRDLFDVKLLLETEGLSDSVRKAFVVYLASHNRPMHELLSPNFLDLRSAYEGEFMGMVDNVSPLQELEAVRKDLVRRIQQSLTDKERAFLLSVKRGNPDWNALDVSGIERLPGIQWKLANIQRMSKSKQKEHQAKLEKVLNI
ncbi:MAG: nucleotidyl transferase AbiEii/AbiGii toxin family protein [Myxococcales bacterium]|nr:MAG: nucleotidyl transferase AbiEii/AbiGii toxin family protein [Myxococcales bacterium]